MKTQRLAVDPGHLDSEASHAAIARAAEILRSGGLVALPTETVYGLGASAIDPAAVAHIFAAKRRPSWDPIIVHTAGVAMTEPLVENISDSARALMSSFWPGPLTLLLPRSTAIPDSVTAGRPLVGIRVPAHPVALELIRCAGVPIAAPSANVFGHISPTTADHVLADLDGRIDAILDAGPTAHGVESTVLDPTQSPMIVYRPGAIAIEKIRAIAGPVDLYAPAPLSSGAPHEALPSPGVGIRHYAPKANVVLVESETCDLGRALVRAALSASSGPVGMMLPGGIGTPALPPGILVFDWGTWSAPEELARSLYAGLRELDSRGCRSIVCPLPPAEGIGAAIRDRLFKAARN